MEDGTATNEVIVGAACTTVVEHVVVATVEDASVAWSVIECVPGDAATVCEVDVLPLPHTKENGAMPFVAAAVHVMFDAVGAPEHEAVNAEAAPTNAKESMRAIPVADAIYLFCTIVIIVFTANTRVSIYPREPPESSCFP